MPNLKVVMISPLRRCLQTTYLLFRNHPRFNDIKFIIDPYLKEHLDSPCDIPLSIGETIRNFKPLFPDLDCSLLDDLLSRENCDPNLWFVHIMASQEKQAVLAEYKRIKNHPENQFYLDFMGII